MASIDQTTTTFEPITVFSVDTIWAQLNAEYIHWLKSYRDTIQVAPGFISFDCISTPQPTMMQHLRLVKFESKELYFNWTNSSNPASLMYQHKQLVAEESPDQYAGGTVTQFNLTAAKPLPAPPFWKRALVTICCVYPLLMVLIWLLTPALRGLPSPIAMLINVVIVGSLLTHPILPFVFRVLAPWLNRSTMPATKKVEKTTL